MDLKKNAPLISIKLIMSLLIVLFVSIMSVRTEADSLCFRYDKRINKLVKLLDNYLSRDSIQLLDGIVIKKYKNQKDSSNVSSSSSNLNNNSNVNSDPILNQDNKFVFQISNMSNSVSGNQCSDFDDYIFQKLGDFFTEKVIDIRIPLVLDRSLSTSNEETARVFSKSPFLTGFGLGFLAFGLKKLLLPLFIGAQIVKSILIAMFLPSILGSVGKLVGKGVSTFAQSSGSSGLGGAGGGGDSISDFDFKDTGTASSNTNMNMNTNTNSFGDSESAGSETGYNGVWTFPDNKNPAASAIYRNPAASYAPLTTGYGASQNNYVSSFGADFNPTKTTSSKYSSKFNSDINKTKYGISESFYTKEKQQDYKVFQNIPSSSQLLANYDPFYSPLLSRIDAVFKTLGYTVESCREKLVCFMYKNPAKYAPYSNLISAQLSRELNELRKPSTDNPEILRFFRYMKAAKDGQDGSECDLVYPGCTVPRAPNDSPPMVSTFNDINKLVHARHLRFQQNKT